MLNKSIQISKPIPKLRNGHRKKYNKNRTVHTYNECSFDCLFSLFAVLYVDYEPMRVVIDSVENSDFCIMVKTAFDSNGKSLKSLNRLYEIRDKLMERLCTPIVTDSGLISIDCKSNIDYTIEHVLPTELFSYYRKKVCTTPTCDQLIESNRVFVDINVETFAHKTVSIQDLSDHLNMVLFSEEVNSVCPKSCGGVVQIETKFSNVIFIDLQVIDRENNKRFSINDAPQNIELYGSRFKILALIQFIRDDECLTVDGKETLGHYILYIKRNNLEWEKYDDTNGQIERPKFNERMEVHTLVYVKDSLT